MHKTNLMHESVYVAVIEYLTRLSAVVTKGEMQPNPLRICALYCSVVVEKYVQRT